MLFSLFDTTRFGGKENVDDIEDFVVCENKSIEPCCDTIPICVTNSSDSHGLPAQIEIFNYQLIRVNLLVGLTSRFL